MKHYIFNRERYPSHHVYLSSNSINIHSRAEIKDKDIIVMENGTKIKLFTKLDFDGVPRKSTYYDNCNYYEFKYTKLKK